MLVWCCFDAGPASKQHQTNIEKTNIGSTPNGFHVVFIWRPQVHEGLVIITPDPPEVTSPHHPSSSPTPEVTLIAQVTWLQREIGTGAWRELFDYRTGVELITNNFILIDIDCEVLSWLCPKATYFTFPTRLCWLPFRIDTIHVNEIPEIKLLNNHNGDWNQTNTTSIIHHIYFLW